MTKNSVGLDVGSGTGRFSVYLSWLHVKASVGFDCCPSTVHGSAVFAKHMESKAAEVPRSPVILFRRNLDNIRDFGPATHIYSFNAYSKMLLLTARVVASSKAALVWAVVLTHTSDVVKFLGLPLDDEDIAIQTGLGMPGGYKYTGVFIHLTDRIKKLLLEVTAGSGGSGSGGSGSDGSGSEGESHDDESDDESDAGVDFGELVKGFIDDPERNALKQGRIIDNIPSTKKERGASDASWTKMRRFDQEEKYHFNTPTIKSKRRSSSQLSSANAALEKQVAAQQAELEHLKAQLAAKEAENQQLSAALRAERAAKRKAEGEPVRQHKHTNRRDFFFFNPWVVRACVCVVGDNQTAQTHKWQAFKNKLDGACVVGINGKSVHCGLTLFMFQCLYLTAACKSFRMMAEAPQNDPRQPRTMRFSRHHPRPSPCGRGGGTAGSTRKGTPGYGRGTPWSRKVAFWNTRTYRTPDAAKPTPLWRS